ncbi:unnamed protein product [Strongylus vulgaris]|uniref:ABC transporter domain-containing protein n=2 Tax=Strongylus vulgaris TaxID=40348 RepID=A0A3P7JZY5_STRVU|nr:unnamed protein product [Strongylus vulgaris]
MNLTVKQGQTVALVGVSGCGKSTIVQLFERYYDTQSGEVCIDNHNVRNLSIRHLRDKMAVVGQEPTLFNMTIRENIMYGLSKCTQKEIENAARRANIHDFIVSLPKLVQETLDKARKGRTCLVIAHRLSTIQNADQIVVCRDGHVVEQGTHQTLLSRRGIYYNFVQRQNR